MNLKKGKCSLFGGFLKKEVTLEEAVERVLTSLTGFNKVYLEQLSIYCTVDRGPWERTLSTAYYVLIDNAKYNEDLIEQYSAKWLALRRPQSLSLFKIS